VATQTVPLLKFCCTVQNFFVAFVDSYSLLIIDLYDEKYWRFVGRSAYKNHDSNKNRDSTVRKVISSIYISSKMGRVVVFRGNVDTK